MTKTALSLAEQAYEKLKDEIITVQLNVGEILSEAKLAERFKVSKTPVREALNRLQSEGFVEVLPFKGYLVAGISVKDIQELFQIRRIVEGAAAELAVAQGTEEEFNRLEEMARIEYHLCDEESYRQFSALNHQFHLQLAQLSRNSRLVSIIANVVDQSRRVLFLDLRTADMKKMSDEHRELVETLKKRDPNKLRLMMEQHIDESKRRILQRLME